MTAEIDLLPLPEMGHFEQRYDGIPYQVRTAYTAGQMHAYARANMESLLAENERLAEALREAKMRIAAIGYPASPDGEYSKDGEWTFSDAVPRAVDAEEVEAAFLVIRTALAAQQGGRADG